MRAWAEMRAGVADEEPNLDSLFQFVGFDESNFDVIEQFENERYRETQIRKRDSRTEIDFGRLLFAYALDHVTDFMRSKGVVNFRLRIGNAYRASQSYTDSLAFVKLEFPDTMVSEDLDIHDRAFVFKTVTDKAGLVDGTYGYPVDNSVEYVGVLAPTALQAEAYATAFLAMGVDEIMRFYDNYPDEEIETLIIYREGEMLKSASTGDFDARVAKLPTSEEVNN
jgi:thiamine biosynthesis lipoprotein